MAGKRILIADDDPEILSVLEKRLRQKNYEVVALLSGKEAIDKCKSFNPDLVILDMLLRDTDGYSVASALRKNKTLESVPIIFVTGQELDYSVSQKNISELVNCDFLPKLGTFEDLLKKIKEKIG